MQSRFAVIALLGFVLIAVASCGGSDGLSTAEEKALEERLAAAEEAEAEAERERQAAAAEAERERQAAAAAAEAAAEAERQRQAEEEARLQAEADAEEAEKKRKEEEAKRIAAEEAKKKADAEAAERERQAAAAERERQAAAAEAERQRQAEAAAEAERQRQAAQQQQLQEQLAEAQQAEVRARASSLGAELNGPEMGTATVEWTRGNTLTFKPEGSLDRGSAAPSVPGGWQSASFTGHSGTANALINDTVYLYTNIQAPGTRAFWKKYGLTQAMTDILAPLAKGSSATAKTETQTNNSDPDNIIRTTDVTEITVRGSFDGAGGTFTCDSDSCMATDLGSQVPATSAQIKAYVLARVRFDQGRPIFTDATEWTFEPSSIASGVPLNQDDAYLYFGAWSSIPDMIVGTYDFRYIAGGGADQGPDTSAFANRFAALEGPATFRGGAVGRYVTQGQVGGQNAKIGTFTASATLNADFTADTLSGRITDFREDGSTLTGWRVTLGLADDVGKPARITGTAVTIQANGTVANIGGLSVGGSWGATFYGSGNVDLGDPTKYPAAQYPPVDLAGVVGWFDATGPGTGTDPNDVAIAGAFGATPSN